MKKNVAFRLIRSKWCPKLAFLPCCQVSWSLDFLSIGYDNSLKHYVNTISSKSYEKKLDQKLSFSPFSQVWRISFPLSCIEWYLGTNKTSLLVEIKLLGRIGGFELSKT